MNKTDLVRSLYRMVKSVIPEGYMVQTFQSGNNLFFKVEIYEKSPEGPKLILTHVVSGLDFNQAANDIKGLLGNIESGVY